MPNQPLLSQQLRDAHHEIERGMAEIKAHCDRPVPDLSSLAAARVRLSRASGERSRLVREAIVPALLQSADPDLRRELSEMLDALSAKRGASSKHVAIWSSAIIERNWDGYRQASMEIRRMMDEQIQRERAVLGKRLIARGL